MALADNIVGYWKMDGDSTDAVGSEDGADTSVTYDNAYGIINQGVKIENTIATSPATHYITFSPTAPGTGSFSISLWVYMLSIDANTQSPFSWEKNGVTGRPVTAIYLTNSYISWNVLDNTANDKTLTYTDTIAAKTWYHLVLTRDATSKEINLYINGTSEVTETPAGNANINISSELDVGRRYNSSYPAKQHPFRGYIEEMGYWSRALSASEISQLYNSGSGLQYPFSASSGNIKKINNIAWANVKKVNNIAVANIKKINGIAAK